ncbi:allophanate hydrolase-related protein [Caulobacter segnis]
MPLHRQLTSREARLVAATKTAPTYKLYAIANSTPPKPALVHVGDGGSSILVEVYELDVEAFGSFTAEVPRPAGDRHGGPGGWDLGERLRRRAPSPDGATDITALGGWRAYIASLQG